MSGKILKEKAQKLSLKKGSKHKFIQALIVRGFFDIPKTTIETITEIRQIFGRRLKSNEIQPYIKKFMDAEIIRAINIQGVRGNLWVLMSMTKKRALQAIAKNKKTLDVERKLFSESLVKKLKRNFRVELDDLSHNFGKSGTCTAFLLRKILEKLIHIAFAKNGKENLLEDENHTGGLKGLESMIEIATREKIQGIPFLIPKTAKMIKGIKFLGDSAAHNPLINIDMKTILPQMPYIITAYKELAKRL